jgi:hypothetical protein
MTSAGERTNIFEDTQTIETFFHVLPMTDFIDSPNWERPILFSHFASGNLLA